MILLTMLLIPIFVAICFYLFSGSKITLFEFLAQNVIQAIFVALALGISGAYSTHDTEVWNGRVAKKYSQQVSCEHIYRCFCYTSCSGSGENQSCHEVCQTCYEHSYDVDWNVTTTNNETLQIDRINRQGTNEPPRYTNVKIGEPTTRTHSYKNYIKASPDSLFRKQGLVEKYQKFIPTYPGNVYDYYRINRTVLVNNPSMSELEIWDDDLDEMNADLGKPKKVNIITVVTKDMPEEYFYALEQSWIGSKFNDFVVVMNIDASNTITWVNIMAFTKDKLAEVVVRDEILAIGTLNRKAIMNAINSGVSQYFVKRKMSDFEYLKNSVTPSKGLWIFCMIFGLLISVALGIFFMKNEHHDIHEAYMLGRNESMSTVTKVLLGFLGLFALLAIITVSSVIGINNDLVQQEAGLTAQYKQNQNNYDNMVKKVLEVAQVPSMAADDLQKLTKEAIAGRYGKDGSKAVFQFIKEQNPTVSAALYTKIQTVVEAGRNSFEADQKVLLDKKRVYETALNTFPAGFVAKFLGFPKIDLATIDIITSDRTQKTFATKKDEALKLRETK